MSDPAGRTISHYQLVEKIGEGGMGVVWKANDIVLGRTVAIKVLPADLALDEARRRMFLDEARLAGSVSHGNIVQVHELGREGNLDFIVMEHVEGQALSHMLHRRLLPPDKVAMIGLQVAEGLARAHRKGLIHRDLKPSNILITPDGDVKIVDFGLATLFSPPDTTVTLTAAHAEVTTGASVAGTLPYMSPEQVQGERLDARSDIFSFGTVLYEMTTGRRPFTGVSPADIAQDLLRSQPIPVSQLVPSVPSELCRIIDKALSRRPADRYQTIDDMAVDLRRLGKELESGSTSSFSHLHSRVGLQHHRSRFALVAALAMAIAAIAWGRAWLSRREVGSESSAQTDAALLPNWILVADFEGPPADPSLALAVRELLTASLEQSGIVVPLPRPEIQRAIRYAMKPDTTRVVGDFARELAVRAGARTYIEGRVDHVASGFSLVVRVVDAESGRAVTSVSAIVDQQGAFISSVDRIGREIREKLGEDPAVVRATRRFSDLITPSFEAFLKLAQAYELAVLGADREASLGAIRSALALDPEFAQAWVFLGQHYADEGLVDSARVAFHEAMRRPERLTEFSQLAIRMSIAADIDHDLAEALRLATLGERLTKKPNLNVAEFLFSLGRTEEALEAIRDRLQGWPGAERHQWAIEAQVRYLTCLGRPGDARVLLQRLEGYRRERRTLDLLLAESRWDAAESLVAAWRRDPTIDDRNSFQAEVFSASLHALQGQLALAAKGLEELIPASPTAELRDLVCFARLQVRHMQAEVGPGVDEVDTDTTVALRIITGIDAAMRQDSQLAERYLRTIRAQPQAQQRRYATDITLLQGWLASSAESWQQVVDLLGSTTTAGQVPVFTGRLPIRWLVANAYEELRVLDKAATAYEQLLAPIGLVEEDRLLWGITVPFAHHKLVLLYAHMGRLEAARHHWQAFQQTFTHPDAALAPMIDEARSALATAVAKP